MWLLEVLSVSDHVGTLYKFAFIDKVILVALSMSRASAQHGITYAAEVIGWQCDSVKIRQNHDCTLYLLP